MNETKKLDLYANIAAICFVIVMIYSIWQLIKYGYYTGDYSVSWPWVVMRLIEVGLAVLLFMKRKNIGLVVIAAIGALLETYFLIRYFSIWNVMLAGIYISFLILVTINCVPSFNKYANMTKFLWFIPFSISLLYYVSNGLYNWFSYRSYYNLQGWVIIVVDCASFLFAGMWLSGVVVTDYFIKKENECSLFDSSTVDLQLNSLVGGADELMKFNELLESGTISQAEFEEIKKKILGL